MPRPRHVFRARTVILEPAAEEAAVTARKRFNRFDEAMDGLEWLLARSPDRGLVLKVDGRDTRIYVQASGDLMGVPEIWVVYSFDENEVVILNLKAV